MWHAARQYAAGVKSLALLPNTLYYLTEFDFARQGLVAAVLVAVAAAVLSPFVVLKRLAFVGQGISHAAFGGIGLAAVLGLSGLPAQLVILVFCLAAALLITSVARAGRTHEDTAIGIVLVGGMAAGILLIALANRNAAARGGNVGGAGGGLESILFGSVQTAGALGVWLSLASMVIVGSVVWWFRRPLVFFAFDDVAAEAAGVRTGAMRTLLMMLLAVVVVVGMRLVGVVLISALLVLPGAIASQLTQRLTWTFALSVASAVIGVVGGLAISFELDAWKLPSGPCMVLTLVIEFALAMAWRRVRGG